MSLLKKIMQGGASIVPAVGILLLATGCESTDRYGNTRPVVAYNHNWRSNPNDVGNQIVGPVIDIAREVVNGQPSPSMMNNSSGNFQSTQAQSGNKNPEELYGAKGSYSVILPFLSDDKSELKFQNGRPGLIFNNFGKFFVRPAETNESTGSIDKNKINTCTENLHIHNRIAISGTLDDPYEVLRLDVVRYDDLKNPITFEEQNSRSLGTVLSNCPPDIYLAFWSTKKTNQSAYTVRARVSFFVTK
jgi:hypothetical protein